MKNLFSQLLSSATAGRYIRIAFLPVSVLLLTIISDQWSKSAVRAYFTPPCSFSQTLVKRQLLNKSRPAPEKKIFLKYYKAADDRYIRKKVLAPTQRRELSVVLESASLWKQPSALPVFGRFFWINFHENSGVAFGMFSKIPPQVSIPVFALVSLAAIIFLVHFYRSLPPQKKWIKISLLLILGGAAGNLIDRIFIGRVTDFFDLAVYSPHYKNIWPLFNLADAYIVVGVILLVILMFFENKDSHKSEITDTPETTPHQDPEL